MNARYKVFLAIVRKTFGHLPRAAVEEWAMMNFDRLEAGLRGSRFVPDAAMTAWYRSAPPSWMEAEAKALWGRGWAQGKEVDG